MTFEHITVGGVVILSLLVVLTNFYMVGRYATKREAALIDGKLALEAGRVTAIEADLSRLRTEITGHVARIEACEADDARPPTRSELQRAVSEMAIGISRMTGSMEGMQSQLATNNQYLHTLIEKGVAGR